MAYIFQILCSSFEESVPNQSNSTNRIFAPESLLIRTCHLLDVTENVSLFFRISTSERSTHCSIKEFTASPGFVYLPGWMMSQLQVSKSNQVSLQHVFLPKGRLAKFLLQDIDVFTGLNIKEVLEVELRQYSCLTLGDCIEIPVFGQTTRLTVTKLEPSDAVDIVDINLTIELDWKIPKIPFAEQKMPDFDYKLGSIRFWRKPEGPTTSSELPQDSDEPIFPGQGNRLALEPETTLPPEPEMTHGPVPPVSVVPGPRVDSGLVVRHQPSIVDLTETDSNNDRLERRVTRLQSSIYHSINYLPLQSVSAINQWLSESIPEEEIVDEENQGTSEMPSLQESENDAMESDDKKKMEEESTPKDLTSDEEEWPPRFLASDEDSEMDSNNDRLELRQQLVSTINQWLSKSIPKEEIVDEENQGTCEMPSLQESENDVVESDDEKKMEEESTPKSDQDSEIEEKTK